MQLLILGHFYQYEMENLTRVFYPDARIRVRGAWGEEEDELCIVTEMIPDKGHNHVRVCLIRGDWSVSLGEQVPISGLDKAERDRRCELRMANLLFNLLVKETGYRPAWGILTGVRPIKLLRRLIHDNGEQTAVDYFRRELRVSEEKIKLAMDCQRHENVILDKNRSESFSLYISIPFCPTRCAYCSFVSQSVERARKLIAPYLELLLTEMRETAKIARELGLRLETVYIGGGTPTILSPEQLSRLTAAVFEFFDASRMCEFTVEAGRPDTIDRAKLDAMLVHGVTRVSINPQTLNDKVLEAIGRRHTGAQTLQAFAMAREAGFRNINMDLIAGLPNDTLESFQDTLQRVIELSPESVTVHTLSMKKSARLVTEGKPALPGGQETAAMAASSQELLYAAGYIPYYLYRQSKMLGNLENVGWSKRGYEGHYNAYIMDETHTILACGAGGVTKLRQPGGDHIERIFNYKFPYEYCNRFEEMLARKKGVVRFYEKFSEFLY